MQQQRPTGKIFDPFVSLEPDFIICMPYTFTKNHYLYEFMSFDITQTTF